ncbi:hypothetical protein Acr_24g0005280 [Actinidia rufa]|uniref:Uncharacterized protein n=1 Tax=Actinidia rufa TaxID=165716 RepID=A0A7J0GU76_9ERIC|nr:hypothetical protein Acr_24g0005280 [Actinidia rufa]
MASRSSNYFDSRETCRKPPHAAITFRNKGDKLLVESQRAAKAVFRQKLEDRSSEDRTKGLNLLSQEGRNRRQRSPHIILDSRSDSKSIASSKWRTSPNRALSSVDLCKIPNAKRNWEGGLHDKLNNQNATVSGKVVIPARSVARITRPVPRKPIRRYQMSFSPDIEEMDPPE